MTSNHVSRSFDRKKLAVFVLIPLIVVLLLPQMPKVQATTTSQDLQDKSLSFLRDVIQLDLSKYTLTLNPKYTENEHLFYTMDLADSYLFPTLDGNAIFNFYNGTLGHCSLNSGDGGLQYLPSKQDNFNRTLGIVERYQALTKDPQVQQMANMLEIVGSERNTTEVSGNLTLRISSYPNHSQFSFYITINGAEYTGLTIFLSSIDLDFADSRVYQKIGDTSISVSKEQAINIAENYIKTYSYYTTLGNGTQVKVSNLNVTGVYAVTLQTIVKEKSTLYPYWNIMLNISNMPASGLQGLGVQIWANNGAVSYVYPYVKQNINPFIDAFPFYPLYSAILTGLSFLIAVAVVIIVVVLLVLRSSHKAKSNPPS